MAKKTDDTAGTDVTTYDDRVSELYAQTKVEQSPLFSDDVLSEIETPEQLAEFLAEQGVVSESIESYGTGFRVVRDKRQLIDVPLALIQWRFNIGDKGAMVIVHAMTQDKRKVIFVDGGTGIRDQLERVTVERRRRAHKHPQAALSVPGGLRVSDYTFEDPKTGEERDASTFYLAE
jgi:hypothetical protein